MLIGKNALLFVILRFWWYSLTVGSHHCQEWMKTWFNYEGEAQKSDNAGKIHCKKNHTGDWFSWAEISVCWGTQRLVVSLKGTHTDFISLQCMLMTPWCFWQVPIVPASSCVCETQRSDVLPVWGAWSFPEAEAWRYWGNGQEASSQKSTLNRARCRAGISLLSQSLQMQLQVLME